MTAKYVAPEELVGWYQDGSIQEVLIVDVREDDYTVGKLPGSIHVPFHQILPQMSRISSALTAKTKIVFHCYFSQTRGPSAAQYFVQELGQKHPDVQVLVLTGGWKTWRTHCSRNDLPHLLERLEAQGQ